MIKIVDEEKVKTITSYEINTEIFHQMKYTVIPRLNY